MGLDQYAYFCSRDNFSGNKEVDFNHVDVAHEFFYWRKHPNLHGWMQNLYIVKGGQEPSFNCSKLRLNEHDIDELEAAVKADKLPQTSGFFFGTSSDQKNIETLEFIKLARQHLADGMVIYYYGWF